MNLLNKPDLTLPRTQRKSYFSLIVLLILNLPACSLISTQPKLANITYNWQKIEPQLRDLEHWTLLGKFAIRTPEDSVTAAINKWTQKKDQFEIDISSTFFGLGSSKLIGSNSFLVIQKGGEEPVSSLDPDALVEAALGIPLPLSGLASWIKALPSKDSPFEQILNEQGLPETILQDDWTISFSQYHQDTTLPLPGKIKIEGHNIRIVLAVKKWTLE